MVEAAALRWLPQLQAALLPPHLHTALLASSFVPAKALYAATQLGVADALSAGPLSASQLAEQLGVQEDGLRRVLRCLTAHGVFAEVTGRPLVFANTRSSRVLQAGHPATVANMVKVWGDESFWAHERLADSLQLGAPPAFELQSGGQPFFDWLDQPQNRERRAAFDQAMVDAAATTNPATLQARWGSGGARGRVHLKLRACPLICRPVGWSLAQAPDPWAPALLACSTPGLPLAPPRQPHHQRRGGRPRRLAGLPAAEPAVAAGHGGRPPWCGGASW